MRLRWRVLPAAASLLLSGCGGSQGGYPAEVSDGWIVGSRPR